MSQSQYVPPPEEYVEPSTLADIHTFLTTVLKRTVPPVDEANCAICMRSWDDGNSHAVRTPCGHVYHFDCIAQWLHPRRSHQGSASWFSTCPMDRIDLCYNDWGSTWILRFRDADHNLPQLAYNALTKAASSFKKYPFAKPEDLFWKVVKPLFRIVLAGWKLNKTPEWSRVDRAWLSDAAVIHLTVNILATQLALTNKISLQDWINLTHLRDWYIVDKYGPDQVNRVDDFDFSRAEDHYIRSNPMRYRFRPEDAFGRGMPRTFSLLAGELGADGIGPATHKHHVDCVSYPTFPLNRNFPLYEHGGQWSVGACFFHLTMGREDKSKNEYGKESESAPDYVELVYGGCSHMFSADWDLENASLTLTQRTREGRSRQMELKFGFESAVALQCQACRDRPNHHPTVK